MIRRCWTGVFPGALLAALLSFTAGAGAQDHGYPPAGSPDPGSPCARKDIAQSTRFFCDFITLDRWLAAGRPDFVDANGKHWQPWFYGKDGLTNQLLIEGKPYRPAREGWLEALFDVEAFQAEDYSYFWDLFRYTPWSVQFRYVYQCGERQMVNPRALYGGRVRRQHWLALGWEAAGADADDPTAGFDPDALPVLETLANLEVALGPEQRGRLGEAGTTARDEVNAMAEGRGLFWPDYDRDAEVWLVRPGAEPEPLDDLDAAAARLAEIGLLVTNDVMGRWRDGYAAAVRTARARGALLYIYFAGDAFEPRGGRQVYRQRLGYLLDRATEAARGRDAPIKVVSHGRSSGIVAGLIAGREKVVHEILAPAPGSWGRAQYDADSAASGDDDFVSGPGREVNSPAPPMDCLGPYEP